MVFLLWNICLGAFSLTYLGLCIHGVITAPLSRLPGPWYTSLTDAILIYKEFTAQRRLYIHELHKKFGPVVRLGPSEVSFTSLEALKEIYQSGGSGYDKTEFYNLFTQYGKRTTFSTLGKWDHTQMKRYIAGPYAKTNIMQTKVLSGIQDRANTFVTRCEESKSAAMDFYVWLHCFALDCASFHLLHPYGTKSLEGIDLNIMREMSYRNDRIRKWARYHWPTLSSCLEKVFKPAPASLSSQYVLSSSGKDNTGEHSLAYKLQNSDGAFQQIDVAAECLNHLAAGIDTTGDALCFLIYQLSLPMSSQIQDKLIAELSFSKDKALDELPYLDAVIKEGLRCFPPIPMSQPRYVPIGGRMIDGYSIPEGAVVSCQAWSVHQLNEKTFVQGEQFKPERWLDPHAALEMNRLFFSFSAGGRACTGRQLAMVEMKCLLRELYSRYQTRIAREMKGSMVLSDQTISTRPLDQTCKLIFEPIR